MCVSKERKKNASSDTSSSVGRFSDLSMNFQHGSLPSQNLLLIEIKPPHRVKHGERPDFIKIANEMKDSMDNMIQNGLDDFEVAVFGVSVQWDPVNFT